MTWKKSKKRSRNHRAPSSFLLWHRRQIFERRAVQRPVGTIFMVETAVRWWANLSKEGQRGLLRKML